MSTERFDAIVIGSGIGGLAFASLAAQLRGWRVAVLERHWRAGGFTHAFEREGWSWDVGLHYVGGLAAGSPGRGMMDLVTGGAVRWAPFPSGFDQLHIGDTHFTVPGDAARFEADLVARFPHERAGLRRWFAAVDHVGRGLGPGLFAASARPPLSWVLDAVTWRARRAALQTTQQVLDACFGDPVLKALLAARWGDYGAAPSDGAFGFHALVTGSYHDGAWYPVGGASTLAAAVTRIVESHGGAVLTGHDVREVVVEDGRAVGVRVVADGDGPDGRVLRAPRVISDTGAVDTYTRLIDGERHAPQMTRRVRALAVSPSAVTIYLGLLDAPTAIGLDGANHWITAPGIAPGSAAPLASMQAGDAHTLFVSFASANDPTCTHHTAQIVMFADGRAFDTWAAQPWQHRDEAYETLKAQIAWNTVDRVDRVLPGFAALVKHTEVSTPLSVAHFTGRPGGAVYGLACTPARLRARVGATTPLPGLWLAGADVCSPGIQGALMGGVFAVAATFGARGFPELMARARDTARTGALQAV
ncbi:MAG: NAD(P)/FAD-dependent oxidoreductase [Burkholderiales bacterium]|nr:NAD(P)/FAD-dependent oxidoreductase [Burkholderiales bacterium]